MAVGALVLTTRAIFTIRISGTLAATVEVLTTSAHSPRRRLPAPTVVEPPARATIRRLVIGGADIFTTRAIFTIDNGVVPSSGSQTVIVLPASASSIADLVSTVVT